MSPGPESLILQMLREMRAEIGAVREQVATKRDVAELGADLRAEMNSLRADVASDLLVMRKELGEQIVGLRRAIIEYHTSTIGHAS